MSEPQGVNPFLNRHGPRHPSASQSYEAPRQNPFLTEHGARQPVQETPERTVTQQVHDAGTDFAASVMGGVTRGTGSALRGIHDFAAEVSNVLQPEGWMRRGFDAAGIDTDFIERDESWLYQAGDFLERIGGGVQESVENPSVVDDLGGALGNLAGQAAAFVASPTLGAGMVVGQGADLQAQRADQAGVTEGPERTAAILGGGAITGLTERIPIDRLLDRYVPDASNRVVNWLLDLGVAGTEEAAQEVVEGAVQDLLTQATTDPEQPFLEGIMQEAANAGGAAAVMRAIIRMLGGARRRPGQADPAAETPPPDAPPQDPTAGPPVSLAGDVVPPPGATGPAQNIPQNIPALTPPSESPIAVAPPPPQIEQAPPPPPADRLTGELQAILDDARPADEVMADRLAQDVEAAGLPDSGATVRVTMADGSEVTGQVASYSRVQTEFDAEPQLSVAVVDENGDTLYEGRAIDVAMQPVNSASQAPAPVRAQATRRPESLLEFIARRGGIFDEGGDLRRMGGHEWHRGKPFQRRLLAPDEGEGNRYTADYVREAAADAGYLSQDSDINDLFALIEQEVKSGPVFTPEDAASYVPPLTPAEQELEDMMLRGARLGLEFAPDASLDEVEAEIDERLALMAEAQAFDAIQESMDDDAIPFPGAQGSDQAQRGDDRTDRQGADRQEREGGDPAAAGVREGPPAGGDRAAPEGGDAPGGLETELTDQGEQTLVPGVKPITDKDRAQAGADRAMRGGDKPADEGLFGPEGGRLPGDLFADGKPGDGRKRGRQEPRLGSAAEARQRADDALRAEAERIAGKGVALKIVDQIIDYTNGEVAQDADGMAIRHLIQVATYSPSMGATLRHEVIHYLKERGLISGPEWQVLERVAKRSWMDKYDVRNAWADDVEAMRREGATEAQIDDMLAEEAVAEAFAHYIRGKLKTGGRITTVFRRIGEFVKALVVWANNRGTGRRFTEILTQERDAGRAGDIFAAIDRGDMATRSYQLDHPSIPRDIQSDMLGALDKIGIPRDIAMPMTWEEASMHLWMAHAFGELPDVPAMPQRGKKHAAWHGTPHDFDQFSTDKIGTGEGVQAYGWGLYFAGNAEVARWYRKKLTEGYDAPVLLDGRPLDLDDPDSTETMVAWAMLEYGDAQAAMDGLQQWLTDPEDGLDAKDIPIAKAAIEYLRENANRLSISRGRLYEVDLAPAEDEYLDWDKSTLEQSEKVQAALARVPEEVWDAAGLDSDPRAEYSGEEIYRAFADALRTASSVTEAAGAGGSYSIGQRAASRALAEAGIPGIRYLDGSSRGRGEGSHNYVIFDDSHVTIRAKFSRRKRGNQIQEGLGDRIMVDADQRAPFWQRIRDVVADRDRLRDRMMQNVFDQFHAIAKRERLQNQGRAQSGETSAWKAALRTQNLRGVMSAVLKAGPLRYDAREGAFRVRNDLGYGFEDIFSKIAQAGKLRLWSLWAIAVRAERLHQEGREKLMGKAVAEYNREHGTNLTVDQAIAEFKKLFGTNREFGHVHARYQRFQNAMLDMMEQAGLINADQRSLWFQFDYVPFYRALESDTISPKRKGGLADQRSGIHKLRGGEDMIADLLENMVAQMTYMVDASFKNIAMQRAIRLLLQTGEAVRLPNMEAKGAIVPAAAAIKALQDIGANVSGLTAAQKRDLLSVMQLAPPQGDDVVSVMVDGKPQYYRIEDPLLFVALTNLHGRQMNILVRFLRGTKNIFTQSITATPVFMLRNLIRDSMQTAVVTGKPGWKFPYELARNFRDAYRLHPDVVAMMAAGSSTTEYYRTAAPDVRRHLQKIRGGVSASLLNPRTLWEAWQRVGHAAENTNRLLLYRALRREGKSVAEAAHEAQDLMNFSMRGDGDLMRLLISTVPFMNARLQGLYKVGRAVAGTDASRDRVVRLELPRGGYVQVHKGVALRGAILSGLAIAYWFMNHGEDWFEELPEWDRDANWHFMIAGQHVRVPKPFEFGAIFSTIPERLMDGIAGDGDWGRVARALGSMVMDTFAMNPGGNPLIWTGTEQLANRNFFFDMPIVPQWMEGERLPELQYTRRTGATAIDLGRMLGVSPARIEHLVAGLGGTIAMDTLSASDWLIERFNDAPERPTRRTDEWPLVGWFLPDQPARSTRWVETFYDLREDVTKIYESIDQYEDQGDLDRARELYEENAALLAERNLIEGIAMDLSDIRKAMDAVQASDTMTPDEKRAELDRLQTLYNRTVGQTQGIQERVEAR